MTRDGRRRVVVAGRPIAVAGTRIPPPAIAALTGRMREGPFATADLVPLTRDELARCGGPVSVAYQVVERVVRRAVREGDLRRADDPRGPVATWAWVGGDDAPGEAA